MPTTEIKRPNYYEGQYLGAHDLAAAQEYQRQQDQRHHLAAHTWGIAAGLELTEILQPSSKDAADVYLQPGYAVDGFGRSIVVLEPYKIPAALFARYVLNTSLPDGEWIPVWLRYREEKTNPPRPGFAVCDVEDQAYRVLETFRVIVGEMPESQQRDKISVSGEMVDADHQTKGVPDASVPYQAFPDAGTKDKWLIRVGSVRWLAPNSTATKVGHFVMSDPAKDQAKVREGRRYLGVVAENVLAPAGKVRIKDRHKHSNAANETGDLAAVEGSLRVDENAGIRGKLGVGNLNPQARLHVAGDIALDPRTSTAALALPANGTMMWNDGTWLRLNQNLDYSTPIFGVHTPGVFAPGSLNVGGGAGWGDPGLGNAWITGNLGIGTTSPTHKFHVLAADAVGLFESTGTQAFLRLSTNEGLDNRVEITNRSGGRLSLWTVGGGDVFNITRGGNVGIGTTNPSELLTLGAPEGTRLEIARTSAQFPWRPTPNLEVNPGSFVINLQSGGAADFALMRDRKKRLVLGDADTYLTSQEGGSLRFLINYQENGQVDALHIDALGNVGIGTPATPAFKLDVAGVAHASSFPSSSDDRFKTNIRPLKNVLDKVQRIRGVTFEWNETYAALGRATGKPELGVVAQEVAAVFPELVSRWGAEQHLAVDYGRMSAVLLEAIKELAAQNATLSLRIEALEKKTAASEKPSNSGKRDTKTSDPASRI